MRIVLPSAKLAFQYTQEVPAQITKYCQLMNRPCTASEAINSVTFAYKKTPKHPNKKKNPSKHFVSFHSEHKQVFSSRRQILYLLPNSWHGSLLGNSMENNSSSQWMATFLMKPLPSHDGAFCASVADLQGDLHPQYCPA